MKKNSLILLVIFSILIMPLSTMSAQKVPLEELIDSWSFYGKGVRQMNFGMFHMKEGPDSKGVMIVSPESYGTDVTVRYEMMPMSASSVCVVLLSASDSDEGQKLTIPSDYDGSIGIWMNTVSNYFFAFHNEAHNTKPFVKRCPEGKNLAKHDVNVMDPGNFYTIETGRSGKKLWLEIDGKRILTTEDPNSMMGGHIAFRLRGLNDEPASCLIRKLEIETKPLKKPD